MKNRYFSELSFRRCRPRGEARFLALALAGTLLALPGLAADDAAVVSGPAGVVTPDDVRAGVSLWVSPENRQMFMSNPRAIEDLARGVYSERTAAAKAQAEGLANEPAVARQLVLARDRVLAAAWVDRQVGAVPADEATIDKLARSIYNAEPQRFQLPEQVHARHILVAAPEKDASAREAARTKAQALLAELRSGADFAKLAQERSDDKGSGARGGDLGFFDNQRMAPAFSKAAFALNKPGQLSEVVETQFGYHIIRLEARKPAGKRPYDEVAEELRQSARERVERGARQKAWAIVDEGMTANPEAVMKLAKPAPLK